MKKEIVSVPKIEYQPVQTGISNVEIWITSDGGRFENEQDAEHHEFLWRVAWKNKNLNLHYDPETFEFESLEDAIRYFKIYSVYERKDYSLEELSYPCKVVKYSEYSSCDCALQYQNEHYCTEEDMRITKIIPLEDYKKMMIEYISDL
jgi:hypothetical protein